MDYVPKSHDIVRKIFETQSVTEILNGMRVNEQWKRWLSDKTIWKNLLLDRNFFKLFDESVPRAFGNSDAIVDGIDLESILSILFFIFEDYYDSKGVSPSKEVLRTNPESVFLFIWTMQPHLYLTQRDSPKLLKIDPTFFLSFPYEHSLFYRYSHMYESTEDIVWDHVLPNISVDNLKKRNIAYIHFDYSNDITLGKIWKSNIEDHFPELVIDSFRGSYPKILSTNFKEYRNVRAPCYVKFYFEPADGSIYCTIKQTEHDVYDVRYTNKDVEYIIVVTTVEGRFIEGIGVVSLFYRRVNERGVMTYFSCYIPYFTHYEGEGERINTHMY